MLYDLYDCFDVWGNEKDGYEINNLAKVEEGIYISDEATNGGIVKFLKEINYLTQKATLKNIYVRNDGESIEVYEKRTMKPLYSLRKHFKEG